MRLKAVRALKGRPHDAAAASWCPSASSTADAAISLGA